MPVALTPTFLDILNAKQKGVNSGFFLGGGAIFNKYKFGELVIVASVQ